MHLQNTPDDHEKIVHCVKGNCLDVVLDLRPNSPTFGVSNAFNLRESYAQALLIPRGCAHGFCALEDETCLIYITNSKYSRSNDSGVRWDSFGFKWPIENPIISQRDLGLLTLEEWIKTKRN
jgi:dTDP-4-dehydrorhamnose 3,5-epimerase